MLNGQLMKMCFLFPTYEQRFLGKTTQVLSLIFKELRTFGKKKVGSAFDLLQRLLNSLGVGHTSEFVRLPTTPSPTRPELRQGRVQTPTTPELYSMLNLSYQSRSVSGIHHTSGHFYI